MSTAAAAANTLLYLNGVTVSFDGFKALNELSLVVEEGELRTIIGPNGAGKTTMMDVVTGKTRPDSGEVYFRGTAEAAAPARFCRTSRGSRANRCDQEAAQLHRRPHHAGALLQAPSAAVAPFCVLGPGAAGDRVVGEEMRVGRVDPPTPRLPLRHGRRIPPALLARPRRTAAARVPLPLAA